ncbi:MAG: hypothetical protein ACJ76Y_18015 [Thermoanaerobaculia bacterium]
MRAILGAAALAALLGVGVVSMVYRSGLLLGEAGRWARLDPAEARRRTFGPAYVDAVEAIRRDLPDNAWYLLFPPREPDETGWALWVRHDLAPRRPILIHSRGGRGLRTAHGAAVPQRVRWAVLPGEAGVPVLLTREEALARLRDRGGR